MAWMEIISNTVSQGLIPPDNPLPPKNKKTVVIGIKSYLDLQEKKWGIIPPCPVSNTGHLPNLAKQFQHYVLAKVQMKWVQMICIFQE